jgi:hypothetical protein
MKLSVEMTETLFLFSGHCEASMPVHGRTKGPGRGQFHLHIPYVSHLFRYPVGNIENTG